MMLKCFSPWCYGHHLALRISVFILLSLGTTRSSRSSDHHSGDGDRGVIKDDDTGVPTPSVGFDTPSTGTETIATEATVDADGLVWLPFDNDDHQPRELPMFPYVRQQVAPNHDFKSYTHRRPQPDQLPYAEYKGGDSPYNYKTPEIREQSDALARSRRIHVKDAMKHAWAGYKQYAWGYDELLPVSHRGRNNWGGMGTTLVDSMSTLWLLNMTDEFSEAVDWVRDFLSHHEVGMVSIFETTIRSLGGLLSAYDLSGEAVLLEKADDLGARLMQGFDSPSGIPYGRVNLKTGEKGNAGWMKNRASLAEFGTLQVEFRYLAAVTGKHEYAEAVERIFQILEYLQPDDGLIPIYVVNTGKTPAVWDEFQRVSFGSHGDSAYEYMLKIWLQGGRREMMYRHMYDRSIDALHEQLLFHSNLNGLAYVAQRQETKSSKRPVYIHSMEHLTCFLGGTLALGAYTDPNGLDSVKAQRDLRTARALTYTCYQMYQNTETGAAPEAVSFNEKHHDLKAQNRSEYYLLRPETVESFYILNKLTGDPIYREWGWEIFQSIERYCKLPVAYGKLKNVNHINEEPQDMLESFFLSETLKYLYLLQDPDSDLDLLSSVVFNTEAHPLRMLSLIPKHSRTSSGGHDGFPYLGSEPTSDAVSSFVSRGGGRYEEYKTGDSPYDPISQDIRDKSDELARKRRSFIVSAMKHAWHGYKTYAFGHDELLPRSMKGNDPWGGMGTTLVDSLDTLWLMDLRAEFWEARDWVRDHLNHDNVATVSVFETTIRSLGGLLSAYDLSDDITFLNKADDLGSRLLKAFDSPSGIPYGQVHLQTGEGSNIAWVASSALLAEYATLQVEFRYLARATGKKEYAIKAERIFEIIEDLQPHSGLLSLQTLNLQTEPRFRGDHISFGAMGDSAYEYMLKQWLQGGRKEMKYRLMYDKAIQGLHNELLVKSTPSGLLYVAEKVNGKILHKMDHLVCFLSGTLALGAYTDPYGVYSPRAQRDLRTAKSLAYTCYQMYARSKTGLSPEIVKFRQGDDFYIEARDAFYILRPEAVESFFILDRLTSDPIYREWGWEIFLAIERYCKLPVAYGSRADVHDTDKLPSDRMESFFLAETLKYLFLLNDPDTDLDIVNKHVFNTEAHPLRLLEEVQPLDLTKLLPTGAGDTLQQKDITTVMGHEDIGDTREELRVAEQTVAAQAAQLEHWKTKMAKMNDILDEKEREIHRLREALRRQQL